MTPQADALLHQIGRPLALRFSSHCGRLPLQQQEEEEESVKYDTHSAHIRQKSEQLNWNLNQYDPIL
jgi:hypothetical protein